MTSVLEITQNVYNDEMLYTCIYRPVWSLTVKCNSYTEFIDAVYITDCVVWLVMSYTLVNVSSRDFLTYLHELYGTYFVVVSVLYDDCRGELEYFFIVSELHDDCKRRTSHMCLVTWIQIKQCLIDFVSGLTCDDRHLWHSVWISCLPQPVSFDFKVIMP